MKKNDMKKSIQKRFIIFGFITFVITYLITFLIQTNNVVKNTRQLINYKIQDAEGMFLNHFNGQRDLLTFRGDNFISKATLLAAYLEKDPSLAKSDSELKLLAQKLNIDQIFVFDKNLYITHIWPPIKNFKPLQYQLGRSFFSDQNERLYRILDQKNYSFFHAGMSNFIVGEKMQMSAVAFRDRSGGVMIGGKNTESQSLEDKLTSLDNFADGLRIGNTGHVFISNDQGRIICISNKTFLCQSIADRLGIENWVEIKKDFELAKKTFEKELDKHIKEGKTVLDSQNIKKNPFKSRLFKIPLGGIETCCLFDFYPVIHPKNLHANIYEESCGKRINVVKNEYEIDWYIFGGEISATEVYAPRDKILKSLSVIFILACCLIFLLVSFLIQYFMVRGVQAINRSLEKITAGDLDEEVSVRNCQEFTELSEGINKTVQSLRTEVQTRLNCMAAELTIAEKIQRSAIPSLFPPYPNRTDFDVYGTMNPARTIGGDFFDFLLIDSDHLFFMIADVSGKGTPAALFMMNARAYVRSLVLTKITLKQLVFQLNNYLANNNDAGMFLTAFFGVIQLSTGMFSYVNAAHPMPYIIRQIRSRIEVIPVVEESDDSPLCGLMKNLLYRQFDLQLLPGDRIFQYTDGVNEAMDAEGNLYGMPRIVERLGESPIPRLSMREFLEFVRADINKHVNGAEQSDDLTMLLVDYWGQTDFNSPT